MSLTCIGVPVSPTSSIGTTGDECARLTTGLRPSRSGQLAAHAFAEGPAHFVEFVQHSECGHLADERWVHSDATPVDEHSRRRIEEGFLRRLHIETLVVAFSLRMVAIADDAVDADDAEDRSCGP